MSKIKNCSTCQNSVLRKTDSEAEFKCAHCVLNTCKPYWNGDAGYYEPFNFSVGDYVETLGGDIGYVDYINPDSSIIHVDFNGVLSCPNFKFKDHIGEFKRIGKYDFTKQPEITKIEKLSYPSDWIEMRAKINEVIDRINEIGEKNDQRRKYY